MMRYTLAGLLLVTSVTWGWANTYRVTNTADSGTGSLRWAIDQANKHIGRDKVIFRPGLKGKVIRPASQELPWLMDHRTVIQGDVDSDGVPDIALNGSNLATGSGLSVRGRYCTISGLAITGFPDHGIDIGDPGHCTVRGCHLGVNLAGTRAVGNGRGGLICVGGGSNLIGGPLPAHHNYFGTPAAGGTTKLCIQVSNSPDNVIVGNRFGITRDGAAVLGDCDIGIVLDAATNTQVGGVAPGERNIFGGLQYGVMLAYTCVGNAIVGNTFGLLPDGETLAPISYACIRLSQGAQGNRIGGAAAGEGNVFAGCPVGVHLVDSGTTKNRVQGNAFGTNLPGTTQRRLETGVLVERSAGGQTIGGGTAAAGNTFCCKSGKLAVSRGVWFYQAGEGSVVRNNVFGVLPSGEPASMMNCGVSVDSVGVRVADNRFVRVVSGLITSGLGGKPAIYHNTFSRCGYAVQIMGDSWPVLGNLGNSRTDDDGRNLFRRSNLLAIQNNTAHLIRAEGNDFGTTVAAEIDARIEDRKDYPAQGPVDYDPLIGGIHPTGAWGPALTVSAVALPVGSGAEVVFSLSAPASVTVSVLNITGRPVAMVAGDQALQAGTQRVVWSGRTVAGTQAPAGRYVVRVQARDEDGGTAQALASVAVVR